MLKGPAFGLEIGQMIFLFFFFSVSGWIGESIMESIVRRRPVSKGFFKGPYVPVHGVGAFVVYGLCSPLRANPSLVFLLSVLACTAVEYLAAVLLETVFGSRGWDYATYPFTRWCHFRRRIALTTSLFFGLVSMGIVYFYWDWGVSLARLISPAALVVFDVFFAAFFLLDLAFTGAKCAANKRAGIPNKTAGLE